MDLHEERSLLFGEQYEDFEPAEILSLIHRTGEWLSLLLMDDDAANKVMRSVFEQIGGNLKHVDPDMPWRDLFERYGSNHEFDLRSSQFMVGLNAFAFYGMKPDTAFHGFGGPDVSIEDAVGRYVAMARSFLDSVPQGWINLEDIARTVLAAEARFYLDTGNDVTPEQLAALARISLKSMRNQMSGQTDLKPTDAGVIPNAVASRWIASRSTYLSSIWQAADPNVDGRPAPEPEAETLGEVLFVPVAKDGTWFDPVTCRTSHGYTIGPKGDEETLEDYREALSRLAHMSKPCWRRSNAAGNRGIVTGVNWIRKEARELSLDADGAH